MRKQQTDNIFDFKTQANLLAWEKKVANLEKQSLLACSVIEKEKAMKEDKERREQCE